MTEPAAKARSPGQKAHALKQAAIPQRRDIFSNFPNEQGDLFRDIRGIGNLRNLSVQFGHLQHIRDEELVTQMTRNGTAYRLASFWPNMIWHKTPEIRELDENREYKRGDDEPLTDYEKAVREYAEQVDLWGRLRECQVIAHSQTYCLLLIQTDTSLELSNPLKYGEKWTGLRPLRSYTISITYDTNTNSKRYGLPEFYYYAQRRLNEALPQNRLKIHWSRVVHIIEPTPGARVLGVPLIKRCFNALQDIYKNAGARSEESFRRAANPTLIGIDNIGGGINPEKMTEAAQTAFDSMNQVGIFAGRLSSAHSFSASSAQSTPMKDFYINLSAQTGIPRRIFEGSEEGKLAAEQDGDTLQALMASVRTELTENGIIEPWEKLFKLAHGYEGVVSRVKWPENDPSPEKQAQIGSLKMDSLTKFYQARASSGGLPISEKQAIEEIGFEYEPEAKEEQQREDEELLDDLFPDENRDDGDEDDKENQKDAEKGKAGNPGQS